MQLFPIGTVSSGNNYGTISGRQYTFFEPNAGCQPMPNYTSLISRFQNMTISTRKKASPYLSVTYKYNNIYSIEYEQIADFIDSVDESVTSFYLVDLSRGVRPSAIDTSSTWTASITNTRLFDTVQNQKADYIFFWNTLKWKIGTISAVTANTSVQCDVDTNNYGAMSDLEGTVVTGNRAVMVYPIYQVYANQGALNSFQVVDYWPNTDSNRGYRYSGDITFISKYKI